MAYLYTVTISKQIFHGDFVDWYGGEHYETIDLGTYLSASSACAKVLEYAINNNLFKSSSECPIQEFLNFYHTSRYNISSDTTYDDILTKPVKYDNKLRSSPRIILRKKQLQYYHKLDTLTRLHELMALDAYPTRDFDGWKSDKMWTFTIGDDTDDEFPTSFYIDNNKDKELISEFENCYTRELDEPIALYACSIQLIGKGDKQVSNLSKIAKDFESACVKIGKLLQDYRLITFPDNKKSITCKKDGIAYTRTTFDSLIEKHCTSEENIAAIYEKFRYKFTDILRPGYVLIGWTIEKLDVYQGIYFPSINDSSRYTRLDPRYG
jgi:hypothetical protein